MLPHGGLIGAAGVSSSGLPSPWVYADIGTVGTAGSATHDSGSFTVTASGADIWSTADSFGFLYQPVSGDKTIVARVASMTPSNDYSTVGVMFRETLDSNARNVAVKIRPNSGIGHQRREGIGETTITTDYDAYFAPYWLRLARVGNVFTISRSPDGSTWTQVFSTATVAMTASLYAELYSCGHDATGVCVGVFDNVSI